MPTLPRESARSVRPPEHAYPRYLGAPVDRRLQDIWNYIAEDNPRAATDLVGAVRAKAKYLSRYPRLGRPGRGKQLRYLPVVGTPYFIVYRLSKVDIEIARVVHGARDWPRKPKRP